MNDSIWQSRRVPGAALLFLVLAITTGWTQTLTPVVSDGHAEHFTSVPAAAAHRPATAAAGYDFSSLQTHREFQASLAANARTLYQSRVIASRAQVPAPPKAKAKAKAPPVKAPAVKAPAVKAPAVKAPAVKAPAVKAATYSGTNHFWFPALGMSRSVHSFPCTRSREPDNYVYRWGCAGANNVYLLGHAWGVFKPLHDAYLSGRLKVGMIALYADANGHVRKYRVTSWRVVNPTNSSWAVASQPVPSMTLQTCVGLNRLNVRLVAAN